MGLLTEADFRAVRSLMLELNDIGPELAGVEAVRSITDVTGFGLLGHLSQMCEASNVFADIEFARVPTLDALPRYLAKDAIPGGTARNFESYGHKVSPMRDDVRHVLCDPQTSGGLLVAVAPETRDAFLRVAGERELALEPFGRLSAHGKLRITVH
jgi:selenide,water dikinase